MSDTEPLEVIQAAPDLAEKLASAVREYDDDVTSTDGERALLAFVSHYRRELIAALSTTLTYEAGQADRTREIVALIRDHWERGEIVCGDELADLIEHDFLPKDENDSLSEQAGE